MAKKAAFWDYVFLVLCVAISFGLGVAFLELRAHCMSRRTNDFVERYCLDALPDNRVRALASGIVQVATVLLMWGLKTAVCAFRTQRLETGISEGTYVALGGQSWRYQVKGLASKRWCVPILVVLLLTYGNHLFQPLLTQATRSQLVYQKTPYDATVFNHRSFYNASAIELPITAQSSFSMLAKLAEFSTGTNSVSTGKNRVSTALVRAQFISSKFIPGSASANLALEHNDTVAIVNSTCGNPDASYTVELATLLGSQPSSSDVIFITGDTSSNGSSEFTAGYVHDITFPIVSKDSLVVVTRVISFLCQNCDPENKVQVLETVCNTSVELQEAHLIFEVGSQNITLLEKVEPETTVPEVPFSGLLANFSRSLESVGDSQGSLVGPYKTALIASTASGFPTGLFNSTTASFLHSRICSSVALSLNFLWSIYENDFERYDAHKSLYMPSVRAYLPLSSAWAIVGCFVGATTLMCLIAIVCTASAKMNIKGATENALFDNIMQADIDERRRRLIPVKNSSPRPAQASNDSSEQRELAFCTMLYCSEYLHKPAGGKSVRVGSYNGAPLQRGVDYV